MPLSRKMYHGGKVWAEVDESGELVVEHGLVQIRYREVDDRTYSAKAGEIEEIDESVILQHKKARSQQRKKAAAAAPVPEGAVLIYTDGSCYGNPGPAGLGALLEWKGRTKEISHYLGEGTNNIAELSAIKLALEAVRDRKLPVRLFTDSAYSIGVLTQDWKAKENRALIAKIQSLIQEFSDLQILKVKGHAGDPRNDRVDQLARDAIDRRQDDDQGPA